MQVVAIHTIHDPEGFKKAEAEALAQGIPSEFKLPIFGQTKDCTKGVCLWEGPSVEAVQKLVDSVVGPYSKNEYYEMTVHGMVAVYNGKSSPTAEVPRTFPATHISASQRTAWRNFQLRCRGILTPVSDL